MSTIKPYLIAFLAILTIPSNTWAQNKEIEEVITTLFDKIYQSDTTGMRNLFASNFHLNSVHKTTASQIELHENSLGHWLESIAATQAGELEERYGHMKISIDHNLAHAWVPYEFYHQGKMTHCGTNSFHLLRIHNTWKINSIIDTRHQKCEPLLIDYQSLDLKMDEWHQAASIADEETFFGFMKPNGIYIGTDASERWKAEEMEVWANQYFQRDTAWHFTVKERQWQFSNDRENAWFDELLDTWMGVCRASGVLEKDNMGEWKLKHYHLSVTIPNDKIKAVIEICGE